MGWVAAALAAIGLVVDVQGGKKAEESAEEQAAEEIRLNDRATEERLRETAREARTAEAQGKALYAGSNVDIQSKSATSVLADTAAEFRRRRAAIAETGAIRATQAGLAGKAVANQYKYQAYGSAAKGASNIASIIAGMQKSGN